MNPLRVAFYCETCGLILEFARRLIYDVDEPIRRRCPTCGVEQKFRALGP